jgi:hypothetical protein
MGEYRKREMTESRLSGVFIMEKDQYIPVETKRQTFENLSKIP